MIISLTKKHNKLIIPAVALFVGSIALAGCSSKSGDTILPPDTSLLATDTALTVQILDAAGNAVDAAKVEVITDSADIIPGDQETQNSDGNVGGYVAYGLNDFTGAQESIQVRVSKDGYLSNNVSVDVVKGTANTKTISITKLDEDIAGIEPASKEGDVSVNPISVIASAGGGVDDGQATVTIENDPGIKTADGTPLSNDLIVNIVQFDFDSNSAIDTFPGGFAVSLENPADLIAAGIPSTDGDPVTDGEVIFQTAGFTAIEVKDAQGNIAKNFTKPIKISTRIKTTYINPETGLPITVGESIPIWSFDSLTGKWRYEQLGVVSTDGPGGLKVDYEISHLSTWNLGYFSSSTCSSEINFSDTNPGPLNVRLSGQGWTETTQYPGDGKSLTINNSPTAFDITMSLETLSGDPVTNNSAATFNLCNPTSHTFSIESPVVPQFGLTVNVSTFCSNDSNIADSPVSDRVVSVASAGLSGSTGSDGSVNFSLPKGQYTIDSGGLLETVVITDQDSAVDFRIPQTCLIATGATGG